MTADALAGPAAPRRRLSPARLGVTLASLAGLALGVGVVVWFGAGKVLAAFEAVGPLGFLLFAGYSLATFALTGAAWWVLAVGEPVSRLPAFIFGRLLRESASDLLPFSSVGGVVVGARGVALRGVEPAPAYGSLALDLVTEIVAQIGFLVLGLGLLSARLSGAQAHTFELCFAAGIALAALSIGVLVAAQRRGLGLLDRVAERVLPTAHAQVQGVRDAVAELYRRPGRLCASVALHGGGWVASAAGGWIALRLMGVPIPLTAAIAMEALLSAVKSAAFVVPNAVGVQEAAYALLGQLFGVPPAAALALSLVRRGRDLMLAVPILALWQARRGAGSWTVRRSA